MNHVIFTYNNCEIVRIIHFKQLLDIALFNLVLDTIFFSFFRYLITKHKEEILPFCKQITWMALSFLGQYTEAQNKNAHTSKSTECIELLEIDVCVKRNSNNLPISCQITTEWFWGRSKYRETIGVWQKVHRILFVFFSLTIVNACTTYVMLRSS